MNSARRENRKQLNNKTSNLNGFEIAIIGMSGRFPGAKNIDQFWHNLQNGVESISLFSDEELASSGVDPAVFSAPNYVKAGGVLENIEWFDAPFFGLTPREAENTDPQHRLFLESAWEALENAGYDAEKYQGAIGIYAGTSRSSYLLSNLYSSDLLESVSHLMAVIGNDTDFLTTRVSYKLNLKGPSVVVQTSCSTSLVAVHLACQSLLSGECDMALAGGVSINVPHKAGYFYQEEGIYSPDGHCRAFDANAKGTVGGNGVGIVLLKRLSDALADGDRIHAVIRGSAINNDGALKIGYTAPSVDGQAAVITAALAMAGVEPETVSYIETHGTGTPLGDPIEIAALTQAFRAGTDKKGFCAIGSVKTNIGHLDAAAGVTGLIKTVLALVHKQLPPSLHFEKPNPEIDFANSPFYVNATLRDWGTDGHPRRAGVSSFGIGGTNAHVVVEEAPPSEPFSESRPFRLIVLSAKTSTALETATTNLVEHLKEHPAPNLADVAYTAQVGRKGFSYRRMLVCRDIDDAVTALEMLDPKRVLTDFSERVNRPVVFMFPGQGAQYVNMGLELYQVEPTFREHVDRCSELLKPHLGVDLRRMLYPSEETSETSAHPLNQTLITQPALFVIEYALAQLWMEWGVQPEGMIGHSIGEYVAACLAGVFSLEDALALVAARGRLMQQMPGGAMLAVSEPEQSLLRLIGEVESLLGERCHKGIPRLSLAAVNAPSRCVVSGPTDAVEGLEKMLAEKGTPCRRLSTSHAFHSEMMDAILAPFTEQVSQINLNPPKIPYISNVTGTWITATEATDASYWARHLRQTVRFADGVMELLKEPERILLEVGPGRTLSTLVSRAQRDAEYQGQPTDKPEGHRIVPSMRHPEDLQSDVAFLLNSLGRVWLKGVPVDWSGFYTHERRHRLPLPTYPFERQRYWIDPSPRMGEIAPRVSSGKKPDIADWFYVPSWKRSVPPDLFDPGNLTHQKLCWLVFTDTCGLGVQLVKQLEHKGQEVFSVTAGERFARLGDRAYTINPRNREDYDALMADLRAQAKTPDMMVHLWGVGPNDETPSLEMARVEKAQDLGFYSLLYLAQAVGNHDLTHPLHIAIVTSNVQEVTGEEGLCPEKATVLGPCKVIPQEYPFITCRSIDLLLPESGTWEAEIIDQLLAELASKSSDTIVAYRGNHRWVQTFEPIRLDAKDRHSPRLREGGVYLITGGLGGVGLELAEYLVRAVGAKLVLIGRKGLPNQDKWEQWLATHEDSDDISRKIRKVQALKELGAEVLVASADVANRKQMQAVINQVYEQFGAIHGVIHAAGIGGGGVIQQQTSETIATVFAPKVEGTLVLDAIFKAVKLDFLVLCSSLISIHAYPGRVEYSAANCFLDAFAHRNHSRNGTFTVSINWDNWREVGMGVNYLQRQGKLEAELEGGQLKDGMGSKEGVEVFKRILSHALPQVAVSTSGIQFSQMGWKGEISQGQTPPDASSAPRESERAHVFRSRHPRPLLGNAYLAPRNAVEQTIAEIWVEALGIERVGVHDNFFELGGDSVISIQIIAKANQVGLRLTPKQIFEHQTIAELAQVASITRVTETQQGLVTGEVRCTPIQRWFFEKQLKNPHHWNLPMLLEVYGEIDVALLEQGMGHLVSHHDALRLRYVQNGEANFKQFYATADEPVPLTRVDLSGLTLTSQRTAMAVHATELQASLNLSEGPLVRVVLFDLGVETTAWLLIAIHHLVVDAVSWRILLEDLQTALKQLSCGKTVQLPQKTTSFKQWAQALFDYAQSDALTEELDYWLQLEGEPIPPLPIDHPAGTNTEVSACTISMSLSVEETGALLQEVPQTYNTQINDILLTALVQGFSRWTGASKLLINLEGHGREEIAEGLDLSRTVGWFTTIFPVLLDLGEIQQPGDAIKTIKEQLRRIPNRGIGYGLLRYLSEDAEIVGKIRALPQPEVSFLYLGQFDRVFDESSPFRMIQEESGPTSDPGEIRSHLLEIVGLVINDRLQMDWSYSKNLYRHVTIEHFAHSFMGVLRSLIAHCQSPEAKGYTPSDFPGAKLSQKDLDKFIAKIGQSGERRSKS